MTLLAEYSFNAGSGSTVADSSGNGHDLTLPPSARAQWVTGKNGGGLYGGTAAYASNDPTANGAYGNVLPWFPFSGSWTVALWAKIPTADGRTAWAISQDAAATQQFSMQATNNAVWFYWLGSGSPFETTGNYADNAWHHWAWTYDTTTQTSVFYVDGAPAAMAGYPPPSGTNLTGTWTAAQLAVVGIPFAGSTSGGSSNITVDDFRIFDAALSQSDVQTWMNTPAGSSTSTTYAAAGTAAAVSSANGSPSVIAATHTYTAAGTVAAITVVHGDTTRVTRTYTATGAVAGISHSTGAVTGQLVSSGAVTASAGATGTPTALLVTHGAVTAISAAAGTANIIGGARTYTANGVAAAVTTSAGSVTLIIGPRTYDASGTIAGTSGTAGTVRLEASATGTASGTTGVTGAATLMAYTAGTVNATTAIRGAVTIASNTPDRDIDVTASPISTSWQVMGTTAYPVTTGAVNNNNGYSAGVTIVDPWAAAPLINQWSTGPIWIQES